MLYQKAKPEKHPYANVVLDYHLRRKIKNIKTKNSLYNKSKTND